MRKASLPPKLVLNTVLVAAGCLLGELIGHLVARDPTVGRDPEDSDLILSCHQPRADLGGCPRPVLARAHGVSPDTLNSRLRIREDRVAVASVLSLVVELQRLVKGEDLSVENLLVSAQMEAATLPALSSQPNAGGSHLTAVGTGPVCLYGVP